jgi:hypothetical protein
MVVRKDIVISQDEVEVCNLKFYSKAKVLAKVFSFRVGHIFRSSICHFLCSLINYG